jgi:hypothetical protein
VREYYQFFKGKGVGEVLEQEEVISKNKNMNIVANHSPIPQPPTQTSREHH